MCSRQLLPLYACLLLALASHTTTTAQTVIDPAQVADDVIFAVQGEYAGSIGQGDAATRVGVHIIALGNRNVRVVRYEGGLPGDGWGAEEAPAQRPARPDADTQLTLEQFKKLLDNTPQKHGERSQAEGELDEKGQGSVRHADWVANVRPGSVTLADSEGNTLGTLQKVERESPTLGVKPPKGAVVLFDGSSAEGWERGRMTEDGLLMEGPESKQHFGDSFVHVEFMLPYMPRARGQGRGNSGLYLQKRYEIQILDSFGLAGRHNEAGGIYSVADPDTNMCYPPLRWQTFDVQFTAARYDDDGNKTTNARMSVWHNGILIHNDREIPRRTGGGWAEGNSPGPVYLQNHRNPVRFRNIWVAETK